MNAEPDALRQRLERLRGRMADAARRAGRDPSGVRLIGASKTVAAEVLIEAVRCGLMDLGENRVQEAEAKIDRVLAASEGVRPRWHLIGPLQSNKAARAARQFDRVHSIDRPEIAHALARHAAAAGRRLPVLVEVNVSGESSKFGVAPTQLDALVREVAACRELTLDGLMTLGPRPQPGTDARPAFARLRELRDRAEQAAGVRLAELSMGMSGDFEAAIEEGSTMVRVGTALFGARSN
ncbi:MAG: YggS family pyridoxal phosphate-dependent enzyme [Candidatus Eiseniibacteriota bacterium]